PFSCCRSHQADRNLPAVSFDLCLRLAISGVVNIVSHDQHDPGSAVIFGSRVANQFFLGTTRVFSSGEPWNRLRDTPGSSQIFWLRPVEAPEDIIAGDR